MENKINIAELLKDCPEGMELDCVMYDNAYLERVEKNGAYPIVVNIGKTNYISLTKEGHWNKFPNAKCIIFPKGKTTWEGFVPPKFKDGDIVATEMGEQVFILQREESNARGYCYIGYDFASNEIFDAGKWLFDRLATEEEKEKFFNAIKDNGYCWNTNTKTLENFIEPKFNVGDKVKSKINQYEYTITDIKKDVYVMNYSTSECSYTVPFHSQNNFELVSKIDITYLKPFDKVLVRDTDNSIWRTDFYSHYENNPHYSHYENNIHYCYVCVGDGYNQCIPYNEETANLIGTTNDCPDKYKIWKNG